MPSFFFYERNSFSELNEIFINVVIFFIKNFLQLYYCAKQSGKLLYQLIIHLILHLRLYLNTKNCL